MNPFWKTLKRKITKMWSVRLILSLKIYKKQWKKKQNALIVPHFQHIFCNNWREKCFWVACRYVYFWSRTLKFKKIFVKLNFFPAYFEKIPSFVCLVFKIQNKWILRLQNLFLKNQDDLKINCTRLWRFVLMITYNI